MPSLFQPIDQITKETAKSNAKFVFPNVIYLLKPMDQGLNEIQKRLGRKILISRLLLVDGHKAVLVLTFFKQDNLI